MTADPFGERLADYVNHHSAYLWLLDFDTLEPAEQALIGTWELEQEIYNGGFWQYLCNESGARARKLNEILRNIGAADTAALVAQALNILGSGVDYEDEKARWTAVQAMSPEQRHKLSELDKIFDCQVPALNRALFQFLSVHRETLDVPDTFWSEVDADDPR